jgi:hypothetical protein
LATTGQAVVSPFGFAVPSPVFPVFYVFSYLYNLSGNRALGTASTSTATQKCFSFRRGPSSTGDGGLELLRRIT